MALLGWWKKFRRFQKISDQTFFASRSGFRETASSVKIFAFIRLNCNIFCQSDGGRWSRRRRRRRCNHRESTSAKFEASTPSKKRQWCCFSVVAIVSSLKIVPVGSASLVLKNVASNFFSNLIFFNFSASDKRIICPSSNWTEMTGAKNGET